MPAIVQTQGRRNESTTILSIIISVEGTLLCKVKNVHCVLQSRGKEAKHRGGAPSPLAT